MPNATPPEYPELIEGLDGAVTDRVLDVRRYFWNYHIACFKANCGFASGVVISFCLLYVCGWLKISFPVWVAIIVAAILSVNHILERWSKLHPRPNVIENAEKARSKASGQSFFLVAKYVWVGVVVVVCGFLNWLDLEKWEFFILLAGVAAIDFAFDMVNPQFRFIKISSCDQTAMDIAFTPSG